MVRHNLWLVKHYVSKTTDVSLHILTLHILTRTGKTAHQLSQSRNRTWVTYASCYPSWFTCLYRAQCSRRRTLAFTPHSAYSSVICLHLRPVKKWTRLKCMTATIFYTSLHNFMWKMRARLLGGIPNVAWIMWLSSLREMVVILGCHHFAIFTILYSFLSFLMFPAS